MGASPGTESRTGLHPRGGGCPRRRVACGCGCQAARGTGEVTVSGRLRDQPGRKRSRRAGEEVSRAPAVKTPPHPGPLSGDATSSSSRGPHGLPRRREDPQEPTETVSSVPSLPPAGPRGEQTRQHPPEATALSAEMPGPARAPKALGSRSGRGRGSSRDADGGSEDEAAPAAASCSVWSGPVRPGSCRQKSHSCPTTTSPSARAGRGPGHFKKKPPGHAPSRSQAANPRAATPRATRGGDANGRAGDGWEGA